MFEVPRKSQPGATPMPATPAMEKLEDRQLLSASFYHGSQGFGGGGGIPSYGQVLNKIEFTQAPTAVQNGLDALATADNLTAPSSTQIVSLGDVDGVETYSVTLQGTGETATLTVDQNGSAVTKPVNSNTTFGTLSGTGTGSDSAAATEISAIATALNLNTPGTATRVKVTTYSDGLTTYTINLTKGSGRHETTTMISVDASGNPVGNETLPFDVIPAAIQNGLNSNAPSGATALADTSTKNVKVATADGVTTYSTKFTVNGTTSIVTVNAAGTLTALPSYSSTEFSDLPSAAQTELQTLANDYGFTGTIGLTQSVEEYTESSGTVIYAVTLDVSKTSSHSSNTFTFPLTIAVDEDGNPTTLPGGNQTGPGFGGGGGGCDGMILDGGFSAGGGLFGLFLG